MINIWRERRASALYIQTFSAFCRRPTSGCTRQLVTQIQQPNVPHQPLGDGMRLCPVSIPVISCFSSRLREHAIQLDCRSCMFVVVVVKDFSSRRFPSAGTWSPEEETESAALHHLFVVESTPNHSSPWRRSRPSFQLASKSAPIIGAAKATCQTRFITLRSHLQ